MSKCWYCNNELTTGDNPKHFGICNKCYDEMFKSGDAIIRSLTNKIAELQKQLEEKDADIIALDTDNYSFKQQIDNLRQQLKTQPAEIGEKIKKQIFNHFNVKNIEEYERLSLLDSLFTADAVTDMLDDILKEYQKTNNL